VQSSRTGKLFIPQSQLYSQMAIDTISLANSLVLLFSIALVAFSASTIMRASRRFSEGKVKELSYFVLFSMGSLLGKLLVDFLAQVLSFYGVSTTAVQTLGFFSTAFIILTTVFLIKSSLLIGTISKKLGVLS